MARLIIAPFFIIAFIAAASPIFAQTFSPFTSPAATSTANRSALLSADQFKSKVKALGQQNLSTLSQEFNAQVSASSNRAQPNSANNMATTPAVSAPTTQTIGQQPTVIQKTTPTYSNVQPRATTNPTPASSTPIYTGFGSGQNTQQNTQQSSGNWNIKY